jgi:MraZ protein
VGKCGEFKINFILLPLKNQIQSEMATFIGKYEAKADIKGRIFIPSAYRKLLPDGERERVVMRKDAENDCMLLFPESVWNAKVEDFKSKLDEWNPTDQLLLMQYVSDAEWLDIDSQGRVLISKKNLQLIGIENQEVLFVGLINHFAVWSKNRYEQVKLAPADFAALLRERMMRKVTPNS